MLRLPPSSLQSPEPRRGSGWGSVLAELSKTYGNKARRQLELLRIEEIDFERGKEKATEAVQTAAETVKTNILRQTVR